MKYKPIKFPQDESLHKSIIEWWYFNGNIKSRKNNYAFMHTLFKVDIKRALPILERIPEKYLYFTHSIISDINKNKTYVDIEPLVFVSKGSFLNKKLSVRYNPPFLKKKNYLIEETGKYKYKIKSNFLDLLAKSSKKPLLEGGKGFLNLRKNSTYYYSLTNLKTSGFIFINNKKIKVSGKSWMDHQWADPKSYDSKWVWLSIQLYNDVEIVCFDYKGRKNMDLIDKKGKARNIKEISMVPCSYWKSKISRVKYPVAWIIKTKNIEIRAEPLLRNQEIVSWPMNYWEGPLKITGKINGKKVSGKGFLELFGYHPKSLIGEYESAFKKKIMEILTCSK